MAVKYKLIKDYPGSPCEVGEIVLTSWLHIKHLKIEEFPMFWERVPEKDYEILAYKYLGSGVVITRTKNDCFEQPGFLIKESAISNANIHSVKRLSDGEIFTVGDEVVEGEILAFEFAGPITIKYKFFAEGHDWRPLGNAKKVLNQFEKELVDLLSRFIAYVEDTAYYNSGMWTNSESGKNTSREQLAKDFLKEQTNVSTNS
jgi:hypothetical protein